MHWKNVLLHNLFLPSYLYNLERNGNSVWGVGSLFHVSICAVILLLRVLHWYLLREWNKNTNSKSFLFKYWARSPADINQVSSVFNSHTSQTCQSLLKVTVVKVFFCCCFIIIIIRFCLFVVAAVGWCLHDHRVYTVIKLGKP